MSVIATALETLIAAGVSGDALVEAIAKIEAAHIADQQPVRTARQERNARYYRNRKAREAEQAGADEPSETVLIKTLKTNSDEQKKGPHTPKENTTHQISTPSAKRVRKPKPEGRLCPDDFQPADSHYAKCREHGVADTVADLACRRMINWSHEHADRDIAWKADWGRALHNFLDGEIEKAKRQQQAARASPTHKPSTNGALARVADLLGISDEQRSNPQNERDHGPVIDHEANGRPYRALHEPAGRQAGGFQAQAALSLLSAGRR